MTNQPGNDVVPLSDVESQMRYKIAPPQRGRSFATPFALREGTGLKWKNLDFALKTSGKEAQTSKSKTVLNKVWGEVPAGKLCCILGPSGAGKTSLLNILAGRMSSDATKTVTGSIMANGQTVNPASYSFKKTVAYVMQEDAVWSTLTCREALLFAANLRIPSNVSSKQKEDLVDLMIAELGLEKCKNVVCGGELIKGISGGEKKRTW